jgi:hypothetical protein
MQFGQRRFWIETVTTKRAMVTASTATFPRTGSIIPTLSYIGATDGKSYLRGVIGEVATASVSAALPSGLART